MIFNAAQSAADMPIENRSQSEYHQSDKELSRQPPLNFHLSYMKRVKAL